MAKRKEVTIEQVRRTVRKNQMDHIHGSIRIVQMQLEVLKKQELSIQRVATSLEEREVAKAVLDIEADVRFYLQKAEEALLQITSLQGAV